MIFLSGNMTPSNVAFNPPLQGAIPDHLSFDGLSISTRAETFLDGEENIHWWYSVGYTRDFTNHGATGQPGFPMTDNGEFAIASKTELFARSCPVLGFTILLAFKNNMFFRFPMQRKILFLINPEALRRTNRMKNFSKIKNKNTLIIIIYKKNPSNHRNEIRRF